MNSPNIRLFLSVLITFMLKQAYIGKMKLLKEVAIESIRQCESMQFSPFSPHILIMSLLQVVVSW